MAVYSRVTERGRRPGWMDGQGFSPELYRVGEAREGKEDGK